jgi:hypothetical protein
VDGLAVAAIEIIDRHDKMSGFQQQFHRMRADVARPPGDHNIHDD